MTTETHPLLTIDCCDEQRLVTSREGKAETLEAGAITKDAFFTQVHLFCKFCRAEWVWTQSCMSGNSLQRVDGQAGD